MVKIGATLIPPELLEKYRKVVNANDRYWNSRATKKNALLSRPRLLKLAQRSLLPMIKDEWNAMSTEDKALWALSGQSNGMTGYNSYVQDKAMRINYGLINDAEPSIIKQGKVGKIIILDPDTQIQLMQAHPVAYWIVRKKSGTKSQYEKIQLTEILTLPFEIAISYKSSLIPTSAEYSAQYYAIVRSEYQGRTIETKLSIPFINDTVWRRTTKELGSVRGNIRSYTLFLEVINMQGTLRFDNLRAEHTGQNWARDKRCNKIETTFTRQYYNVPKHWEPVIIGDNSDYYSEYHTFFNEYGYGDHLYAEGLYGDGTS